jgi:hypothetical protein
MIEIAKSCFQHALSKRTLKNTFSMKTGQNNNTSQSGRFDNVLELLGTNLSEERIFFLLKYWFVIQEQQLT